MADCFDKRCGRELTMRGTGDRLATMDFKSRWTDVKGSDIEQCAKFAIIYDFHDVTFRWALDRAPPDVI